MDKNKNFIDMFENHEKYWIEKLGGEIQEGKSFTDYSRIKNYKQSKYKVEFPQEVFQKIGIITKEQDLSIYVLLLAAYKLLIYKYTDQEDVAIASPILINENQYINEYIVLKDCIKSDMIFKKFLLNVRETVLEGYKHQEYPVRKLFDSLCLNDELLLYKFIFIMDTIHNKHVINNILNKFENDITFLIKRSKEKIELITVYNSSIYKRETIKQFIQCYLFVIEQILENIDKNIESIELINDIDKNKILVYSRQSKSSNIEDKPVHILFEEQVELNPNAIALEYENSKLTYSELNNRANQIGRKLRENGVRPGSIVAIKVERSIEMIVGILAVLKSGGAYIPIDPDLPSKRINYMLKNSDCSILLTQLHLVNNNEFLGEIIVLDDENNYEYDNCNLENLNRSSDLLYVIYTSGSTGKPKGVMIEHKSLVNFIKWRIKAYNISSKDVTLQLISFSFDGFGANLYSTILSGGKLIIPKKDEYNYYYIKELIINKNVTNLSVVPSMYKAILDNCQGRDLNNLNFVVLAAERADKRLIEQSNLVNSKLNLINEYGPTENTIVTTALIGMNSNNISVIGKPIDNHNIYILNKDKNLLPLGIPGELFVSGSGLARGYINRDKLTKEKFIKLQFDKKEINYKTGDIGRWLEDGNIELIGRMDNQVKIRGYRIELDEIEKILVEYELIKEAIVIYKGNRGICAYFVSDNEVIIKSLRKYLLTKLPHYMIPNYFIKLEKIPLLANGKVNRVTLLEEDIIIESSIKNEIAENYVEKMIVEVWQKVLGFDNIGVNEDFFMLGGDSMTAMEIVLQLQEYGLKISVEDLFKNLTIRELAKDIKYEEKSNLGMNT